VKNQRFAHACASAVVACAVNLALVAWTNSAAADICIHTPGAVPGLSGPPIWATGSPGVIRTDLNDPRWAASPLQAFPQDVTANEAAYRILQNGTQLSVSLQNMFDTPDAQDSVYFGFTAGGTVAHLARIYLPAGATDPVAVPNGNISYWDRSGGTWSAEQFGLPPWLKDSALPAGVSGISAWVNLGGGWAINLKADLTGVSGDYRTFLAVQQHTAGTSPPYYLPDYPGATALLAGTIAPQDPAAWELTTALGTACSTGISIDAMHIGTTNTPSNKINTTAGSTNTFYAEPSGIPAPVSTGKVLGKFRIANWGSTIADPHAPWLDIPGAGSVASAVTTGRIEYACVPSGSGTCPTLPGGSDPHQCVLVELRPGPAQTLPFARAAAYRNMDFEALSTLVRPAQITLKGLQAATGVAKDRDVYIYIATKHMPPPGSQQLFLPHEKMAAARRYAEAPPLQGPPEPNDKPGVKKTSGAPPQRDAGTPDASQQGPASDPKVLTPYQAVSEVWPTYEVHVFYDTTTTTKVRTQDVPRLRPMVPFGYFLSHDGPLYGFKSQIEAISGGVLEEIAPNFYRVKMANEGTLQLKTTLTAEERPAELPGGGGTGCPCPQPPKVEIKPHCYCGVVRSVHSGALAGSLCMLALAASLFARRGRRHGVRPSQNHSRSPR
jgi:hypothetical protein